MGSRGYSYGVIFWVETRLARRTLELRRVAKIERSSSGGEREVTLRHGQRLTVAIDGF